MGKMNLRAFGMPNVYDFMSHFNQKKKRGDEMFEWI